ncbi:conserved hypothetical protein [Coccidioides posadasii str. Silveira]|uniref:Peptidase S8/S53 domain-containing protein n=2 Tax=Coccidioides posadasii (strain RMSCC 757 / Silveira) TaxID=443226 RepID=E9D2U9_COCPS|nr:conserved hypothetical protein [Coccidioides posadasii str. Silveira]
MPAENQNFTRQRALTTAPDRRWPHTVANLSSYGGYNATLSSGGLSVGAGNMTLPAITQLSRSRTVGMTSTVGYTTPPGLGGPVVIIVSTKTATLPAVTSSTKLLTLGHTFILTPPAILSSAQAYPTLIIVGNETVTFSNVSTITMPASSKTTFPLTPQMSTNASFGSNPATSVTVVDGTRSLTFPSPSKQTAVTLEGQTTTTQVPSRPPNNTAVLSPLPATKNNTMTPVMVAIGNSTFTFSPGIQKTIVTIRGHTVTLDPEQSPTISSSSRAPSATAMTRRRGTAPAISLEPTLSNSRSTTLVRANPTVTNVNVSFEPSSATGRATGTDRSSSSSRETTVTSHTAKPEIEEETTARTKSPSRLPLPTGTMAETEDSPMPTLVRWPPEAMITPVETEVKKPQLSEDDNDSAVIPCKLWFFSACLRFDNINILGWKITFPPGIYPPGPPPIQNLKFPPPIGFQGDLPPWPKFTVGSDRIPTFPPEPEPTKCETRTASLCSTSTSFVVSTVRGALQTISSQVLPPTCAEVRGCIVEDFTKIASLTTTQGCRTGTATDVVITCSGSETSACATQTKIPRTGCSVTATTTTVSCTPAPPGKGRRHTGGEVCAPEELYIVWPRDGTDVAETSAIYSEMKKLLKDEGKIRASDTKTMGINFWRVFSEPGQIQKIREIPNVVGVHRECTSDCADPLDNVQSKWRYQDNYLEIELEGSILGRQQMVYLSQNKLPEQRFHNHYFFDVEAGRDIPVFIVDTGAQLDHQEFTEGDNIASKTEFVFVEKDYDGQYHRDDAGVPLNGVCEPGYCNPHGTGMLGMIAGANLGVAKKVKPWVVRVPRKNKRGGGFTPQHFLEGVARVNDMILGDSKTTRAILSLSWSYDSEKFIKGSDASTDDFETWRVRFHGILRTLIQKGVFVVTGSGNNYIVNGWPALFGAEPSTLKPELQANWLHVPELLVVGAVDVFTGERWWKSAIDVDKGLPHIYAPGKHVLGTQGNKGEWRRDFEGTYKVEVGTSVATAYAAGLAAYFLRLHQVGRLGPDAKGNDPDMSPAGLKRYIINNGWSRYHEKYVGDIVGIWNGAAIPRLKEQGYCRYRPKDARDPFKLRRRGSDSQLTDLCLPGTSKTQSIGQSINTSTSSPTNKSTAKPTDTRKNKSIGTAIAKSTAKSTSKSTIKPTGEQAGKSTRSTSSRHTTSAKPTNFVCTEETADQCSPGIICNAPRLNGCIDGECVCILPDPPPTTSRTTTLTSKAKSPKPTVEKKPKEPLALGERHCHNKSLFDGDSEIKERYVARFSFLLCKHCYDDDVAFHPGKKPITFNTRANGAPYFVSISWKDGCEMTIDRVKVFRPLQETSIVAANRNVNCFELLYNNWRKCTGNKGRGGYIDVGCVRYELAAKDKS